MTSVSPPSPSFPGISGGDPDAGPPAPGNAATATGRHGHLVRYVGVGLVLAGILVFLLVKGLGSALDFYLPADQAVAQKATLGSKTINLEGVVQPGSIHSTPFGVDFVVTSGTAQLDVHNVGSPPQLFQANIAVIAVGHFEGGLFASDQILVKHSSNYIAKYPARVTSPDGTRQ